MDWNAVSSVSAAVASLIALGALGVSVGLYIRQQNETRAAQVREDIRSFVDAARHLIRLLRDGSPLIAASWHSASTLRACLPEGATVDQARSLLRVDGMGLSLAVVGWGESAHAGMLETAVAGLATTSRRLTGDLSVMSEAGEMLRLMAQDLTMNSIRLMDGQALDLLLDDSDDSGDLSRFIATLATRLHGNSALYFQHRYAEGVSALDRLITVVGTAASQLTAHDLLAVARTGTAGVTDTGTRTDEMRQCLLRLRRRLPQDVVTLAGRLIDDIEATVTTEAAAERLKARAEQPADSAGRG